MKRILFLMLLCCSFLLNSVPVFSDTIYIDLNDFYADYTVDVDPKGSYATLFEDPDYGSVLLSNDPYMGDPGILVPTDLLSMSFDYSLNIEENNQDSFYVMLFDGVSGDIINDYGAIGSESGTINWDLTAIDPSISILGLEFQLNSEDNLFDSSLNIAHVTLETLDAAAPVPEPATLFLLGSGLLGLVGFKRKKK